jgi:hypothetical protein
MFIEIKMLQVLMVKYVIFLRTNIPKENTSYMLPGFTELSMKLFCIIAVRFFFMFASFEVRKLLTFAQEWQAGHDPEK